tara:strand:- start:71 stop:190 length:120 start_codon:yes stop_codon:yes gene_type:complete
MVLREILLVVVEVALMDLQAVTVVMEAVVMEILVAEPTL